MTRNPQSDREISGASRPDIPVEEASARHLTTEESGRGRKEVRVPAKGKRLFGIIPAVAQRKKPLEEILRELQRGEEEQENWRLLYEMRAAPPLLPKEGIFA